MSKGMLMMRTHIHEVCQSASTILLSISGKCLNSVNKSILLSISGPMSERLNKWNYQTTHTS